jgi:hypothetical protein
MGREFAEADDGRCAPSLKAFSRACEHLRTQAGCSACGRPGAIVRSLHRRQVTLCRACADARPRVQYGGRVTRVDAGLVQRERIRRELDAAERSLRRSIGLSTKLL